MILDAPGRGPTMRQVLMAAAVGMVMLVMGADPSRAAVRVCQAPVSSGIASDALETKARAKAIASWTDKAKSAGSRAASWRIADKKILRCARLPDGQFDCVAYAQPCTIKQVAPPMPKKGKVKEAPIAT